MNREPTNVASCQSHRPGRASTVLLAVLFGALAVPVYLIGAKAPPDDQTHTAGAVVRLPASMTSQAEAQRQILTAANVERAIRQAEQAATAPAASPAPSVKSVRPRLGVSVSGGQSPDGSLANVRIACTFRERRETTLAMVNCLAQQFAESVRRGESAESKRAYEQAEQATAAAKHKLDEAQRRLDAFVEQKLASAAPGDSEAKKPAPRREKPKPRVNPDWQAVQRQLDHARAYRAQLLIDRTPLHPMVRAADEEIVDLEKRLAAIPQELVPAPDDLAETLHQMTDPLPDPPGLFGPAAKDVDRIEQPLGRFVPPTVAARPPQPPEPSDSQASPDAKTPEQPALASRKDLKRFLALQHDVQLAEQEYQQAVSRQNEALRRQLQAAPIEVAAARVVTTPGAPRPRSRVAIVALMVALAGAAGVGMIATGIADHATFADAAQARAVLSVPVLGTVPAADHVGAATRRRHLVEGAVLVICGLFLAAAAAAVVLAASGITASF